MADVISCENGILEDSQHCYAKREMRLWDNMRLSYFFDHMRSLRTRDVKSVTIFPS